jgi:hypothetical protein
LVCRRNLQGSSSEADVEETLISERLILLCSPSVVRAVVSVDNCRQFFSARENEAVEVTNSLSADSFGVSFHIFRTATLSRYTRQSFTQKVITPRNTPPITVSSQFPTLIGLQSTAEFLSIRFFLDGSSHGFVD